MKSIVFSMSLLLCYTVSAQQGWPLNPLVQCGNDSRPFLTKGIDTSSSRGVADNYYLWDNNSVILVKFMPGGSQRLRDLVMQYAKEWEQYANIKFNFVPDNTAQTNIRIKLGDTLGHNSYVGTNCNMFSQYEQTMNLDTTDFVDMMYYINRAKANGVIFPMTYSAYKSWKAAVLSGPNLLLNTKNMRGTTLHEFGHALGLLHEQSFPNAISWNKSDSAYEYYQRTQRWNRRKVDEQVFKVSDVFYTNGTSYDPKSIMQYPIEAWQTTNNFALPRNQELSAGDKSLIAALYPKGKQVSDKEVAKVTVTNLTAVDVYDIPEQKGLAIFPSFDIKANSKLSQVYFVARLFTSKGYIADIDNNYNWGGAVAAYVKANILPNTKVSYNKTERNLVLFLPYSEIPNLQGKQVSIEFTVILDDPITGQLDKVMYFTSTTPLSLPGK